jgi:hypothetical protein
MLSSSTSVESDVESEFDLGTACKINDAVSLAFATWSKDARQAAIATVTEWYQRGPMIQEKLRELFPVDVSYASDANIKNLIGSTDATDVTEFKQKSVTKTDAQKLACVEAGGSTVANVTCGDPATYVELENELKLMTGKIEITNTKARKIIVKNFGNKAVNIDFNYMKTCMKDSSSATFARCMTNAKSVMGDAIGKPSNYVMPTKDLIGGLCDVATAEITNALLAACVTSGKTVTFTECVLLSKPVDGMKKTFVDSIFRKLELFWRSHSDKEVRDQTADSPLLVMFAWGAAVVVAVAVAAVILIFSYSTIKNNNSNRNGKTEKKKKRNAEKNTKCAQYSTLTKHDTKQLQRHALAIKQPHEKTKTVYFHREDRTSQISGDNENEHNAKIKMKMKMKMKMATNNAKSSRGKVARFFLTFNTLRILCFCVAGFGLLTTVNAANPTCADTDGTGTAFSSDLCIADGMLRRSDWASTGACVYSTCKTSDCCVISSITVGVLTNQVVKTDTSILDYCSGVAVSPDSKNVYTVSQTSDTLVYWTIDADTQVREHLFYLFFCNRLYLLRSINYLAQKVTH